MERLKESKAWIFGSKFDTDSAKSNKVEDDMQSQKSGATSVKSGSTLKRQETLKSSDGLSNK